MQGLIEKVMSMNKPTKNQANAVREYLASIGHNITHVQALEVIARGAGYRSRHAVGKGEQPVAAPLAATQLLAAHCKKCDTELDGEGYCGDSTCPYHNWPQNVPEDDLSYYSTAVLEQKYGVKRRNLEDIADDIRWDYYGSGCQRSDLEQAVVSLLKHCSPLFDSEESAVKYLLDGDAPAAGEGPYDEVARASAIKAEYNASECHADDVDHAVKRLVTECPSIYQDSRKAWSFINEESHEELDGRDFLVQVESAVFGLEVFTYYTEEERRAGLLRLMAKAFELNDGVTRQYYFSEVNSNIEKNTLEYDQELRMRELEGEIVDGVVHYQGNEIGTIEKLGEGGLTLYSWIDENP